MILLAPNYYHKDTKTTKDSQRITKNMVQR